MYQQWAESRGLIQKIGCLYKILRHVRCAIAISHILIRLDTSTTMTFTHLDSSNVTAQIISI